MTMYLYMYLLHVEKPGFEPLQMDLWGTPPQFFALKNLSGTPDLFHGPPTEEKPRYRLEKNQDICSIRFDSCYFLSKGVNGVQAKFVGTPIMGTKKKVIWVPKSLIKRFF